MKILYCSNEQLLPLLGGGAAGNLRILEKMVERGHDVTVATPLFVDRKPIEDSYGIRLAPCSPFYIHRTVRYRELKYPLYAFLFGIHVIKLLRREHFDLVFIRNCTVGMSVAPITRCFKVPLSISMTDFITGFLFEDARYPRFVVNLLVGMEKTVARSAGLLFVITPRMRREVSGGRLPEDRIVVSFDGVDTGLFDPGRFTEADKEDVYGEIGFRDNIIMFHGVIDPYHGSGLLTEVIQRTIAASPANFLIIACGKGFEQMRREFRSERVKFMDFVPYDQVARYINAAHVGMIPYKPTFTLNQVFTLKFLEYASMGLPTVLFRLKSVEEIFGCHGFTLFSDSPAHFSENLVKALHIAKSEAAVRLIQDEFSWDAVTTRMVSAMEQLTAGGGCRR